MKNWIDITNAQQAANRLRTELEALRVLPMDSPQRSALNDCFDDLESLLRALADVREPEGDHPGDCEANVQKVLDEVQDRLQDP